MALDLQRLVLRQASEDETDGIKKPSVWHDVGVTNRGSKNTVPIFTFASFLPSLPVLIILGKRMGGVYALSSGSVLLVPGP